MQFSLKEIYKDYFNIGAAVNPASIKSHKDLILKHFNSLTCENEMKFGNIHPEEKKYNFAPADKVYDFAKKNGLMLRGHTFVWHWEVPKWLFEGADRETALARLDTHIKALTDRYPDIYAWDVINEGIDDRDDVLRKKTPWFETVGKDYFERVYEIAAKHLPGSVLFYNDYNEFDPVKRDKIIKKIKSIQKAGIPISGVGLQCHLGFNHEAQFDEMKKGLEKYAALGIKIHITELDVSNYPFDDKKKHQKPTFDQYKKQVLVYREFFKILRQYKNEIETVTFWGAADDVSWLNYCPVKGRKNGGLLFDENQQPKEAFYAICDF